MWYLSHHGHQQAHDEPEKRKPAEGIRRSGLPSVTICNLATHVSQAAQSQWYVYRIGMKPGPICSQISLMREISVVMTKCSRHPPVPPSRPILCLDLSPDPPIVSSPKGTSLPSLSTLLYVTPVRAERGKATIIGRLR